ncbi:MAG: glycosyltransferase family 4 protein [Chloroflexi bacterium]|nr:glycosyltransferase family 4 protein [Chloroflexota bacterium]
MRIGIDYTSAAKQGGGIGRITRGLVAGVAALDLNNEYVLLAARDAPSFALCGPNFRARRLPLSERLLTIAWHRAQLPLPVEIWAGPLDVFHAPNFTLAPTRARRAIVTVHDLTFLRYADGAVPALRAFLMDAVPRAARRADCVVADSQATRADLSEWLHLPPDRVVVVYAGVDERFQPVTDASRLDAVRAKYALLRPFVLGLGTLEPRKNFVGLMRAFARAALPEYELVIAGRPGWLHEPILRAARSTPGVRLLGFVDDDDLPALYTLAAAYCLPSHYEGFGIPCIEAMACGTPVVCSDRPCLPEIVDDAALTVSPSDTDALADALRRAVLDAGTRTALIARGLVRARLFPWSRGAADLLAAYRAVA